MLDVLLVESSKAMVQVYKKMIPWKMYGFTIASVCDSEQQAISYFGEYSYALVICDLQLRQGDGLSLIRKLKKAGSVVSHRRHFRTDGTADRT